MSCRWQLRRVYARACLVLTAAVALAVATGAPGAHAEPGATEDNAAVPVLRPTLLAEIPHDAAAYTEGFEIDGQVLYDQHGRLRVLLQAVAEAADSADLLWVLLQAFAEAADSAVLLRVLLQAFAEAANTIGSVLRRDVIHDSSFE